MTTESVIARVDATLWDHHLRDPKTKGARCGASDDKPLRSGVLATACPACVRARKEWLDGLSTHDAMAATVQETVAESLEDVLPMYDVSTALGEELDKIAVNVTAKRFAVVEDVVVSIDLGPAMEDPES